MDIVENRRARLRQWFSDKPIPEKEKSYLSQLMTGKASFGEKAAARLEKTYGMGAGYLDSPLGKIATHKNEKLESLDPTTRRVLELMGQLNNEGKAAVLGAAEALLPIFKTKQPKLARETSDFAGKPGKMRTKTQEEKADAKVTVSDKNRQ